MAPVALNAGQAGITVQTVVAAAALQLHAVKFCSHTHKYTNLIVVEVEAAGSVELRISRFTPSHTCPCYGSLIYMILHTRVSPTLATIEAPDCDTMN